MKYTTWFIAAVLSLSATLSAQEERDMNMPPAAAGGAEFQQNQNKEVKEFKYERPKFIRVDRSHQKSYDRTDAILKIVEKHMLLDGKKLTEYLKGKQYHTSQQDVAACVKDFVNDCKSGDLWKKVEEEVSKGSLKLNLSPVGSPLAGTRRSLSDTVKGEVDKKFPESVESIRKREEKKAEKKYPVYKKGDKVVVTYRKGRRFYRVRGTFYGMGQGGTIQVDSHVISLRDLDSSTLPKFSMAVNVSARRAMVDKVVMAYHRDRFAYEKSLVDKIVENQRKENEKNGFIYYPVLDETKFRSTIPRQDKLLKEKKKQLEAKFNDGTVTDQERESFTVYGWVAPEKILKEAVAHVVNTVSKRLEQEIVREKALEAERVRQQQEAEKAKQQNQQNEQNQDGQNEDDMDEGM